MIPIGTLCIVVRAQGRIGPLTLGKTCVVVKHYADPMYSHEIDFPAPIDGVVRWKTNESFLLPIAPPGDPDKIDTREPEKLFA